MAYRPPRPSALVALLATVLAVYLGAQQFERRTALVIGNSGYKATPLSNPRNDAQDMAQALAQLHGG